MGMKLPPRIARDIDMEIELMAISPVSFLLAEVGNLADIKRIAPRTNEYRSKIGTSTEAFLVFKERTKIGMIPRDIVSKLGTASIGRKCRIVRMERDKNIIAIKLLHQHSKGGI
jgi:hypothetical protein